ncbi:DUF1080 domain-containing protein [Membranicola marinus]|uniref:DUF1080 domain-containing protein n=1 Tax=Membranihabitans marinus TaxID=1227546 RepID=A0A953HNF0_9BACT|nr:DUF1080 domain-containing protein [Membranihabitans marinus]
MIWVIIAVVLTGHFGVAQEDEHWVPLFNGENFDGFTKLNGTAKYHVEEGQMVGVSETGTPNTFMATEKMYGDFILEFEVRVDARLNSGVQIRSNSIPSYRNGRVHGYQVEIDPSSRAYSGGIYDEARRGWIYPLSRNPKGRAAFNTGGWNAYRVEAIGPSIRVWINGVNTANLIDDMTAEGFIGFQVHGIGDNKDKEGAEVRWRNIRISTTNLDRHRWEMDPDVVEINLIPNTLSNQEIRRGWRMLWDGKTSEGWVGAKIDEFPQKGWTMKDGELIVESSGGAESRNGGDIITKDKFSDFELSFEFNITEGANSGVKYFVDPNLNKGTGSAIGLEYQVLDDKKHPDAKKGVSGNRTVASLYDLIPAHNLSVPSRSKPFNGVGNWNRGRILVKGNHVEHWLNGFKVLEYERRTPAFRALVAYSKYKDWPNFGEWDEGHILLQDHGDRVAFRSIKVREF